MAASPRRPFRASNSGLRGNVPDCLFVALIAIGMLCSHSPSRAQSQAGAPSGRLGKALPEIKPSRIPSTPLKTDIRLQGVIEQSGIDFVARNSVTPGAGQFLTLRQRRQ
jgi:hypothetical protein